MLTLSPRPVPARGTGVYFLHFTDEETEAQPEPAPFPPREEIAMGEETGDDLNHHLAHTCGPGSSPSPELPTLTCQHQKLLETHAAHSRVRIFTSPNPKNLPIRLLKMPARGIQTSGVSG